MHLFYNIGVASYGLAIRVASLFNTKAKSWVKGRKQLFDQFPDVSNENVIWFHCASLGEFDQGLPLMNHIKKNQPDSFLLVTFFSPSGYLHYHKRQHPADYVCYLPLDTPSKAKRFIRHFQPTLSIFVKYEFWCNLILEARKNGSKIYNVSGLFRPKQRFFRWYGGFFRKILRQFDHFFVQNKSSEALLREVGVLDVSVAGDSRFDRVIENKQQAGSNEIIEAFKGDHDELIIIGSSWPVDEKMLIPWINRTDKKILIAPHQVDDQHVIDIVRAITRKVTRYTQNNSPETAEVLVLDTIGHLASAYIYGTIAYVGGGFSGSLHNILEPAVFGLPVLFGPKHERFPEAKAFINGGFGFEVTTTDSFQEQLTHIARNYEEISEKEKAFVQSNSGASQRIYACITSS